MITKVKSVEKKTAANGRMFARVTLASGTSSNVFDAKIIALAEQNLDKDVEVMFEERNGYNNIVGIAPVAVPAQNLPNQAPAFPVSVPAIGSSNADIRLKCLNLAINMATVTINLDEEGNPVKVDRKILYRVAEQIEQWAKS